MMISNLNSGGVSGLIFMVGLLHPLISFNNSSPPLLLCASFAQLQRGIFAIGAHLTIDYIWSYINLSSAMQSDRVVVRLQPTA